MNRLPGTITQVELAGSIALVEVEVNGRRFTAMSVGSHNDGKWHEGMTVTLTFKEAETSLAKNLSGLISLRNRIPATITAIERGTILTRVALDFFGHSFESVITTRSSHALSLVVGDQVEALVKSSDMSLMARASS
jgi:molybdate transport system regulatory protein